MCKITNVDAAEKYGIGCFIRASGSVGGARPCQGRGRGFESRLALFLILKESGIYAGFLNFFASLRKQLEEGIPGFSTDNTKAQKVPFRDI